MIRSTTIALIAYGLGCSILSATEPAVLTVSVKNVPKNTQKVTLLIYDNGRNLEKAQSSKMPSKPRQQWNLQHDSQDVKPAGGSAQFQLQKLQAGEYAAFVFCDTNGNGRLDNTFIGFPAEHVGMSGVFAAGDMSFPPKQKPSWKTMKFSVEPGRNRLEMKAFKLGF